MNLKTKTAIVILNWNGKAFMERFLSGIAQSLDKQDARLVIVDNASTDGSAKWLQNAFPAVELITLDRNYGFTGGYNRGLQQIEAEYYVLLNSDVEVGEGWLAPLVEYLDANPQVAACAPKILSCHSPNMFEYAGAGGGFIDKYGYPFCRGRILDHIEPDNGQYNSLVSVFWASGAALAIRAELFHSAGGFDEDFFAHMEEIDLCWRLQLMGFTIANVPQSTIYHVGGGTLPNNSPRKLYLNYRNSLLMLLKNLQRRPFVTLFIRLILDGCSAAIYLLSGQFASFGVVVKAHWAFFGKLPQYIKKRQQQKRLTSAKSNLKIYNGSIVYRYFKSGKTLKFSDIKMKY
ncbi:MAG: glycosyltransferase family 2 protein [Prevotellaceae bacterium]|jgi:GT2 family glycosyltransferase|nr:glycosyltransferase family 2 protein [Prevotellaceae bacterium]